MTLDELKKRAEATRDTLVYCNCGQYWTAGQSHVHNYSCPGYQKEYYQAVSAATVVKLLEMIEVLRRGCSEQWALDRADEIESSLD